MHRSILPQKPSKNWIRILQWTFILDLAGSRILTDRYEQVADKVTVNVGGFVTDDIDPCQYDYIMTCGPEIMMKVLYKKCKDMKAAAPVYVSMENRMACGIGACLVCTCKTSNGNRRAWQGWPGYVRKRGI